MLEFLLIIFQLFLNNISFFVVERFRIDTYQILENISSKYLSKKISKNL